MRRRRPEVLPESWHRLAIEDQGLLAISQLPREALDRSVGKHLYRTPVHGGDSYLL
jgi:hypothetical protein